MHARSIGLFVVALVILSILPVVFWSVRPVADGDAAEFTRRYLAAVYARDYAKVYSWLSTEDRKAKSRAEYLTENPSFSGAALEVARGLARMIELKEVRAGVQGDRQTGRVACPAVRGAATRTCGSKSTGRPRKMGSARRCASLFALPTRTLRPCSGWRRSSTPAGSKSFRQPIVARSSASSKICMGET